MINRVLAREMFIQFCLKKIIYPWWSRVLSKLINSNLYIKLVVDRLANGMLHCELCFKVQNQKIFFFLFFKVWKWNLTVLGTSIWIEFEYHPICTEWLLISFSCNFIPTSSSVYNFNYFLPGILLSSFRRISP